MHIIIIVAIGVIIRGDRIEEENKNYYTRVWAIHTDDDEDLVCYRIIIFIFETICRRIQLQDD